VDVDVGVSVLQTHLSFSFFHWVILLYHPQVILEKQIKQEEKDAFVGCSRWCGSVFVLFYSFLTAIAPAPVVFGLMFTQTNSKCNCFFFFVFFFFILFFSSRAFSVCAETKRNLFSSLAEKERHY
jgi:hypothetical protein